MNFYQAIFVFLLLAYMNWLAYEMMKFKITIAIASFQYITLIIDGVAFLLSVVAIFIKLGQL